MTMARDNEYLTIIRDALRVCLDYKPKLGRSGKAGYTLAEFQRLYQQDPFYNWFGLHSSLVYAAHKAAGGITSVYRQIGIGCERLFRSIVRDELGLSDAQSRWTYVVPTASGAERGLSLDARIAISDVDNPAKASKLHNRLTEASASVKLDQGVARHLAGAVFEVRQGYKSKDSKRQNADISNAANAYASHYLPVVFLFSVQIDQDVAERYARSQWLLLKGSMTGTSTSSAYVFSRDVLGYDLTAFFDRVSSLIRTEVEQVVQGLLR